MAHKQQADFCLSVKKRFPSFFSNRLVLDIGSLDINGNNQFLFEDCLYLGIDLAPARNVDFVSKGHELALPDESFDVIISTECFEHDQHYVQTIKNIVRLLKPGGLFLFTCATTGRPEHGTRRTSPEDAPLLPDNENWNDYYKNLDEADIRSAIEVDRIFPTHEFSVNHETFDLYFYGIKTGTLVDRTDYSFQVAQQERRADLLLAEHELCDLTAQFHALSGKAEQQSYALQQAQETISTYEHEKTQLQQKLETQEREFNKLFLEQQIQQDLANYQQLKITSLESEIRQVRSSLSWRLTMPLRMLGRLTRGEFSVIRDLVRNYRATRSPKQPQRALYLVMLWLQNNPSPLRVILRKAITALRLISSGQTNIFLERARNTLNHARDEHCEIPNIDTDTISILCTRHTLYVGHLIQRALKSSGFKSDLSLEFYASQDVGQLHFVVCPQMFSVLPKNFVAFQMEQSTSTRWFTTNYFKALERACAIFDYSIENIKMLLARGIPYNKIFYVPISSYPDYLEHLYSAGYHLNPPSEEIDVLFYGDPSCERRRNFLDRLRQSFNVRVASEVFGEELVNLIQNAKVVVNIHYYENALLETTRLYETISIGTPVVSEESVDIEHHKELRDIVRFTPIGDIEAMVKAVETLLLDNKERLEQKSRISVFQRNDNTFNNYFTRFLLANDLVGLEEYEKDIKPLFSQETTHPRLCLSLSETPARREHFLSKATYGFEVFEGIRHNKGWIGCGMSYKHMLTQMLKSTVDMMLICEDDVVFPHDFSQQIEQIVQYLQSTDKPWHVFSGIIADVHSDTRVLAVEEVGGIEYIYIDRMVSMIMNIYSRDAAKIISQWNEKNRDPYTNTIDRYLEQQSNLVVVTTLPFLVGHAEEQASSLWGIKNAQYTALIQKSEQLLREKVREYKSQISQSKIA